MNVFGDTSPHDDDAVETNGRLNPVNSSLLKVLSSLSLSLSLEFIYIYLKSLLIVVAWYLKSNQLNLLRLYVISYKD